MSGCYRKAWIAVAPVQAGLVTDLSVDVTHASNGSR
jgi:hypothetical protein